MILAPLSEVVLHEDMQSRFAMDDDHIDELRQWLVDHPQKDLPPVQAVKTPVEYLVTNGWHRRNAYGRARRQFIPVDYIEGTKRDAVLLACGANADQHGLRRTNKDKEKAVLILLGDAEWGQWSDNVVAERCGVTHPFVGKIRRRQLVTVTSPEGAEPRKTVVRKGGTTMDNPAHTRFSLARDGQAPWGKEDADDEEESTGDAVNAALIHMSAGDKWVTEASRLFTAAGRERLARPLLDDIKRAMGRMRKALAGDAAA